jgi:asparagine synthase (glutamine-hydrolysing)
MCGIAGFITSDGASPNPAHLAAMCDALAHRGPDGSGQFIAGPAALGHRRLSIIDLSTGDQPMGNEDGSIQVVFNGEIYNYQELRRELEGRHTFRTQSDTEVLVHLYEELGDRMPERLNGMFAFALWDAPRQILFLARDRLGKKPLYYDLTLPGLSICFASELKALLQLPGFRRDVNPQSVADFLAFSYVPDPGTIFRNARKLEPGSSLTVTPSGSNLRRYWRLEFNEDPTLKLDRAIQELDALAADSVTRRMISDVPLGAFLSGGVDSSAVVAYMSRSAPGRVKTFSIGFTSREFDETTYARAVAERYQTDHYEKVVTPRIEEMLDVLTRQFDEPFGDSSAIPTLYLARMTRERVTVALSGDGADEIFGGYRRYRYGVIEEQIRQSAPAAFRRSFFRCAGEYYPKLDFLPQVFRAKTLLGNLAVEIGDAYFTSMTVFKDSALQNVLSPDLKAALNGYDPRAAYRQRFHRHSHLPPLQQMQAVDIETYLPGDILVKADRATMAYSLEARAPWLDYRIAELSARIPARMKVRGRQGKWIFKKMNEAQLPADILWRRKMGFSVPLAEWFRSSLRPVFESSVLSSDSGWFDLNEVRRIWQQHQSGLHNHDRKLWNLLMLSEWRSRYRPAAL